MWGERIAVVPDNKLGILMDPKGDVRRVLTPGRHWIWDPLAQYSMQLTDIPIIRDAEAISMAGLLIPARTKALCLQEHCAEFLSKSRSQLFNAIAEPIELTFTKNEVVRFRGADGILQEATYVATVPNVEGEQMQSLTLLKTCRGTFLWINAEHVFKYSGRNAKSVFVNWKNPVGNSGIDFIDRHTPRLIAFLNGAAKLSSLDDFRKRTPLEQAGIVLEYLRHFMKWDQGCAFRRSRPLFPIDAGRVFRGMSAA